MRDEIALLWWRILNVDPKAIFEKEVDRLADRNPTDRLAQPGYMGRRYRAGGLVFVSMNPGNGGPDGQSDGDKRQYRALQQLRDIGEASARTEFDELTDVLADIMRRWKIHKNLVVPVLNGLRLDFSEVAYVNLLKWRTKKSGGLRQLFKLSWDDHTREQIDLLAPSRVIALGKGAGDAFQRYYAGDAICEIIPRRYSDVGTGGKEAIERIIKLGWGLPPSLV